MRSAREDWPAPCNNRGVTLDPDIGRVPACARTTDPVQPPGGSATRSASPTGFSGRLASALSSKGSVGAPTGRISDAGDSRAPATGPFDPASANGSRLPSAQTAVSPVCTRQPGKLNSKGFSGMSNVPATPADFGTVRRDRSARTPVRWRVNPRWR